MTEAFVTYCINSMGGREFSGIPSQDVARSIAVDRLRYTITFEDDEDDERLVRRDVKIVDADLECPDDRPYLLALQDGNEALGIHAEERCDACRRPL